MTVCVAAICKLKADGPQMIVGASDRMITAYDIEFQPNMTKTYNLGAQNNSVISLFSGSADSQSSIVYRTALKVSGSQPKTVADFAQLYADEYAAHRRQCAEIAFLKPMGMQSTAEFLDRQKHLAPSIAEKLTVDLQNASLNLESIVTGVDQMGASLYAIHDPGQARLLNNIGFTAIGFGGHHANSTFMMNQYTSQWTWENALYLTYLAKKRAEMAPGVGQATDLFWIGPYPNGFTFFSPEVFKVVNDAFEEHGKQAGKCYADAYKKISDYFSGTAGTASPTTTH